MITKSTILAKDIELQEYKVKLDSLCKKILSNKIILAWIMKNTMKEYENYEVSDIAGEFIEGIPKISKVSLHRDEMNDVVEDTENYVDERITGRNTEDVTVNEGRATFDIFYTSVVPNKTNERYETKFKEAQWIKHYVNVEPQNNYFPGYPIVKRGVYYSCRMISSQYQKEFKKSDYAKIKKVYSVWVCTNPPKYIQNSITKYWIHEENVVGNVKKNNNDYDLLNVIIICIGDLTDKESYKKTNNKLLKLLNVLLSKSLSVREKKELLVSEFSIPMTVEMEGEIEEMCDYSDGIERIGYEKGIEQGMEQGKTTGIRQSILNLMKTMNVSISESMDMLMIPEEERERYMNMM
ncbi:MAG: hypothetical protein IJA34_15210 [Lachnospiraceae bacterium]|nr:hypothetical protein [Lachnospiraceae bacterium]